MSGNPEFDPAEMPEDPFTPAEMAELPAAPNSDGPVVLDRRESEYTGAELHALFAPVVGLPAESIDQLAIIAAVTMPDGRKGFTFGGSLGQHSAKILLVESVLSGLLEAE